MNGSFGPMDILSLLTFGLPVRSGIIEVDSALHRHGVRERVTEFHGQQCRQSFGTKFWITSRQKTLNSRL